MSKSSSVDTGMWERIGKLLDEIWGPNQATSFLLHPQPLLDDATPVELIGSGEGIKVIELLEIVKGKIQ